jgi:hypothetical protein
MTEATRKILAPFFPRNPLISLDSDERIQGNPRKSNSHKLGFRGEMATIQENPKACQPSDHRSDVKLA